MPGLYRLSKGKRRDTRRLRACRMTGDTSREQHPPIIRVCRDNGRVESLPRTYGVMRECGAVQLETSDLGLRAQEPWT